MRWMLPIQSLCALAVLCMCFAGCRVWGTPYVAPDPSRVVGIRAQLFNRPDGMPDIDGIEIPAGSHRQILEALDGASQDRRPMKWQILGRISIVLDEGSVDVGLFRTGAEVGAFRVSGTYYRGGSDDEFIRLLSESDDHPVAPE